MDLAPYGEEHRRKPCFSGKGLFGGGDTMEEGDAEALVAVGGRAAWLQPVHRAGQACGGWGPGCCGGRWAWVGVPCGCGLCSGQCQACGTWHRAGVRSRLLRLQVGGAAWALAVASGPLGPGWHGRLGAEFECWCWRGRPRRTELARLCVRYTERMGRAGPIEQWARQQALGQEEAPCRQGERRCLPRPTPAAVWSARAAGGTCHVHMRGRRLCGCEEVSAVSRTR